MCNIDWKKTSEWCKDSPCKDVTKDNCPGKDLAAGGPCEWTDACKPATCAADKATECAWCNQDLTGTEKGVNCKKLAEA